MTARPDRPSLAEPGGTTPSTTTPARSRLVRAELAKARAARSTLVLVALAPPFCALWAALLARLPAPDDAARVAGVYAMAQQAYVFAMLLGVMGTAGEYRHRTITWAFLATPGRGAVVAAKLAAYGLIGLLVAVPSAAATLLAGASLLSAGGHPALTGDVPLVLLGATASTVLYALLGVALGALIRSQVAAVALTVLLFAYGDYTLGLFLPDVYRWLPTGAARALGGLRPDSGPLLPWWGGGLLFGAYVAAFVLLARLVTLRRDVT
ncbi:ABC transporter permease [Nonomuraea sp. NPDC050783]|uniref:ABC transporter permease n=1 Tax=Nonomuraea sp. NPDC050783 TaxID=3154634 RepID=UPI0034665011